MLAKIDVFDPQTQAFQQAQARAVEELGLKLEGGVGDVVEHTLDFGFGEDDREAFVFLARRASMPVSSMCRHLFVEEEDGVHGHVLGAGGHVVNDGEVGEKYPSRLRRRPYRGVALAVKEDKGLNPMDVGFFGTDGIVLEADGIYYLVEQFGFGHRLPVLRALERILPMRCLVYPEADYTSNLRESRFSISNLKSNK